MDQVACRSCETSVAACGILHHVRASLRSVVLTVLAVSPCATAADSNALVGIHFWGDRNDANPATMLNSQAVGGGGWDLEIVNTDNLARGGWKDEDVVDP